MDKKVLISRIDTSLPLPKYETEESFGFDLLARENTEVPPHTLGMIPGNVVVHCPPKTALLILPRSSTFRKTGLIFPHSVGLIDADYNGPEDEIHIQVYNLLDQKITIQRGDRVAQGLFVSTIRADFEESDHAENEKKSRGGFGSTG